MFGTDAKESVLIDFTFCQKSMDRWQVAEALKSFNIVKLESHIYVDSYDSRQDEINRRAQYIT